MNSSQKGRLMNKLSVMEQAIRVLWETDGGGAHRWDDLYEYPYNEWESNKIVARLRETATKLQKLFTNDVLPRNLSPHELKNRSLRKQGTAKFVEPQIIAEIQHLIISHLYQVETQVISSSETQTIQLSLTFKNSAPQLSHLFELTDQMREQELEVENQKKREQLQREASVKKAELDALEREIARFS